ncbi:MAG TPA: serine hydrolase domain-containing protein [Nocardioidaceae bacterium]
MPPLTEELDALAEDRSFSGVVRCDRGGETVYAKAFGLAERGFGVPNTVETRFGVASVAKGLTALTVVSLVEEGLLGLDAPARGVLGDDLPEIDDAVTVEDLLAHRSGIGDYIDEEADEVESDYLMPVPVHRLSTTEDYLAVLAGHAQKFPPGERFSYCNSGYVVLALLAERTTGIPFPDLVADRVCGPAGMTDTAFLRSDELPGGAARGYLADDGLRTNVLHLPVRGSGDGGLYTTAEDLHRLWQAVAAHEVVGARWTQELLRPRSDVPEEKRRYGLGFWLHATDDDVALLEGLDAGVSVRTVHERRSGTTFTVISNTSTGAWPVARYLGETLLG